MNIRFVGYLLLLLPASAQAQRILTVPFEVRVPKAPTAVGADSKLWLNYELHITNLFPRDLAIRWIPLPIAAGSSDWSQRLLPSSRTSTERMARSRGNKLVMCSS